MIQKLPSLDSMHQQMVLIHPQFIEGNSEEDLQLSISFPKDSECEAFTVPFNPDSKTLRRWQMYVPLASGIR